MRFKLIVTVILFMAALIYISIYYSAMLPVYLNKDIQVFFLSILFLSGFVFLMYFTFIRKNSLTENSSPWKFETKNFGLIDKLKKTFKDIASIVFIAGLFTACFYKFLAMPTKWLADKPVRVILDCVRIEQEAKVLSRYRDIVAVDKNTGTEWKFIWPARNVPSCPSKIVVEGKSWYTGTYIEQVWNVYP